MVYKKTYKKRVYKSKSLLDKEFTLRQLSKKVAYLASMINSELHYHDNTSIDQYRLNNAGSVSILSNPSQGDTNATRTGNSILTKSLFLRFTYLSDGDVTQTYIRVIIFMDKEQNNATAAVTDVLQEATINSPLKIGNGKRFKVLKDNLVTLNTGSSLSKTQKVYIPLKTHIKWNPSASETRENHIYCLLISNQSSTSGAGSTEGRPVIDLYSRLAFYDN